MTAEQKVKKVEPMAMFYNGRIWAGPMPISRRYSRSLGDCSIEGRAWADAWRRIQATTETPEAK